MRHLGLTFAVAVCLPGCSLHVLQDGDYAFTVDRVLRDDCGLAGSPLALSGGRLFTNGNMVRFDYRYFDTRLFGQYLESAEGMYLDGTVAGVTVPVNGVECRMDMVSVHLETTTASATTLTGSVAIKTTSPKPDACACELWANISGTRTGSAP